MVRKTLSEELPSFCKFCDKNVIISEILPNFKLQYNDDFDSIRIVSIKTLMTLSKIMNTEEIKTYLIPIVI